jgi:beta-aspartyl-peptidase (threonine type)
MKTVAPLLLLACLACRSVAHDDAEHSIAAIVDEQEAAWNRGDIEGFMKSGYLQSPLLTFFSGGEDTRGFDPVLERYSKRYKSEGAEMGRLAFTKLEVVPLGDDFALARGRWDLDFDKQKDVGGLFSLVFRHPSDGWRIVHDHTSVGSAAAETSSLYVKDLVRIVAIFRDIDTPANSFVQVRYLPDAGANTWSARLHTGDALSPQHPGIVLEAIGEDTARFKFTDGRAPETVATGASG